MEVSTMNIEAVANVLANSTSSFSGNVVDAIADADNLGDTFYSAAERIVEPQGLSVEDEEAFGEMMENDPENWAGWVKNICGEEWGTVAELVNVNGY